MSKVESPKVERRLKTLDEKIIDKEIIDFFKI